MKKLMCYSILLCTMIGSVTYANAEPKQTTPIVWEDGGEPAKEGEQQNANCKPSGESSGGMFGGYDEEAPVIKGVKNRIIYIGDTVNYKKGIKVIDEWDGNITKKLKVNSKNVNMKKEGKYKVIYSATDKAGNKATKIAAIMVKNKIN